MFMLLPIPISCQESDKAGADEVCSVGYLHKKFVETPTVSITEMSTTALAKRTFYDDKKQTAVELPM